MTIDNNFVIDYQNKIINYTTRAEGLADLTTDIIYRTTDIDRITDTITIQVLDATTNLADTILLDITGNNSSIILTVTPNNGTNNNSTPVNLTTEQLAMAITGGVTNAYDGINVTITDSNNLLYNITASDGDTTNLINNGEGDGVSTTFVEPPIYTLDEMYSWLQTLFDEPEHISDPEPMSFQTLNDYTLLNGWYIDEASFHYFKSGSISTIGWLDEIHTVTYESGIDPIISDIGKTIRSDAVNWGVLIGFDISLKLIWVRVGSAAVSISGNVLDITAGTMNVVSNSVSITGENLWTNIYTLGTLDSTPAIYITQNGTKINSWWQTGHIDILVKNKNMGINIDSSKITIFTRHYPIDCLASTYDYYEINLASGGRIPIALSSRCDLNNTLSHSSILNYIDGTTSDITVAYGQVVKDLNNKNGSKEYYQTVDCKNQSLATVYEVCKYITRKDATSIPNATPISLQTDGASIDGEQYIKAKSSYNNEKKDSPLGIFTNNKFFAAQGVWLDNIQLDDINNYQLISDDGTEQIPPNTVSIQVLNIESGDIVSIFVLDSIGGSIKTNTYTGLITGNDNNNVEFIIQESIADDTPLSGYLRIISNETDHLYEYSSWIGSTFVLDVDKHPSGLTQNYNSSENIYIPIIDTISTDTAINNILLYSNDIPVLVRVRKNGILPFEVEGLITSTGLSVTVIRNDDINAI